MANQHSHFAISYTQTPTVQWKWSRRLVLGLVVSLLIPALENGVRSMQAQECDVIPADQVIGRVPDSYATHMAEKFNCHFTQEYLAGSDNFYTSQNVLDSNVTTIDELVEEFKQNTNLQVTVDRKDKDHPVIHLIDEELGKKSEVLDRKIDFQYSGKVGGIAAAMEKQGIPGIEPPRSGTFQEAYNDHVTKVTIDVKQTSIRDILTHCVDLDEYNRTIWTAKTYQAEDGTWKTQIRFTGPRER